jgi:hypothetical protein
MLFSKHPIVYFIVSAIRFSTLEAICDVLDCQPGDILEFQREKEEKYCYPLVFLEDGGYNVSVTKNWHPLKSHF